MSAAVAHVAVAPETAPHPRLSAVAADRAAGAGGRLTLDELISGVWEGLSARVPVACPVCAERMAPAAEAGTPVGRCGGCGSSLG